MSVGDKVKLTESIWDDGCENHHPPCWLAMKGEILVVRRVAPDGSLGVSHEEITDNSFTIYPKEYESL